MRELLKLPAQYPLPLTVLLVVPIAVVLEPLSLYPTTIDFLGHPTSATNALSDFLALLSRLLRKVPSLGSKTFLAQYLTLFDIDHYCLNDRTLESRFLAQKCHNLGLVKFAHRRRTFPAEKFL